MAVVGGRRRHGARRRSGSAARPTAGSAPTSRWWLADTRSGKVVWRSAGPRQRRRRRDAALDAALDGGAPARRPAGHDLRRHPHPRRRHRSGDHRPDGEGARGHRAPLQLGRGARRHGRGRGHRHAAARRHGREHPQERPRAQGPAHHAGRHRLPLGQRRAPQGIRALRQRAPGHVPSCPAAGSRTWTSCWCGRTSRGSTSGSSTSCRSATIPRAVAESMAIVTRARLRADRPLRLRVRPASTAGEGHHRAQGEHPQDGERPLPRGGPRDRQGVRGQGGVATT